VVSRLLPVTAVQRLGAGQDQLLALLDQVRPVDATVLARRVHVPALVLCGARDPINRGASESLAKALPSGGLHLLPQAGPGWLEDHPDLLVEALRTFLATPE
jgi:pimeloyl-ACP methyl ester carboxylesterase